MQYFIQDLESGYYQYPQDESVRTQWKNWAWESADIVYKGLVRQFVERDKYSRDGLRISTLGYHPMEVAARFFHSPVEGGIMSEQMKLTMSFGEYFEAYALFMLKRMGYKIHSYNQEIEWYRGIKGHPDFIVEDTRGNQYVLDTKTSNDRYFKATMKDKNGLTDYQRSLGHCEVDDERGYLTQVSCYSEALGIPPCILMVNKNDSRFLLAFPTIDTVQSTVNRAKTVVDHILDMTAFEDAFGVFTVPTPVEVWETQEIIELVNRERFSPSEQKWVIVQETQTRKKRVFTGNYRVPDEFKYSHFKELLYVLDGEGHVIDYNYPEKYKHLKP